MTKYVVLGSNAFSGQDFIDLLLDDPDANVIGVSRSPEKSEVFLRFKQRDNLSRYSFKQFDLNNDIDRLLAFLDSERPEVIVNFAAQSEVAPSWDYPEHWFATNCVALSKLVNHLRKQSYLERYLHISSPEVYGNCEGRITEDAPVNPSTPYAASKAGADHILQAYGRTYGFPVITVRATNVYGARQQLFKIIIRTVLNIRQGRVIPLHGGGAAVKSYIHIRDVSRGERAILEDGRCGEIYHLSPIAGVAVRDVVKQIAERMGEDFERVTERVDERPGQDAAYVIDSSKARNAFNWSPTITLSDGLQEVIDWVEANWRELSTFAVDYEHKR